MKPRGRALKLPRNFSPCTLTSHLKPDNSLVVEFIFPPNCPDSALFATGIIDAAAVLGNLFGQFSRHVEGAARQIHAETVNHEWKARQREVFLKYQHLRTTGMRHRAAIRALLIDPRFSDLVTTYGWRSAEFHSTVKSYLGPVPLSPLRSRIQS